MSTYHNVSVPEDFENSPYKVVWESGVDSALAMVAKEVAKRRKQQIDNAPIFWHHEWSEGCAYGREDELDELLTGIGEWITSNGKVTK